MLEFMIHAHITFLYISALPMFGSVRVCNVCMYVCMRVQPEMDVYIFSYRDNCS
jgi:hypothetical protein